MNYTVGNTILVSVAKFRRWAELEDSEYDRLNTLIMEQLSTNTMRLWDRLDGDKSEITYNEYYDIEEMDQDYIVPNHTPVTAVVALTLHTPGVSDTGIDSSKIWFDDIRIGINERFSAGMVGNYAGNQFFGLGRKRVHVCYTAGMGATRLLPLEAAIINETAAWFNKRGFEGLENTRLGKVSYTFEKTGWCTQAEAIIQDWSS